MTEESKEALKDIYIRNRIEKSRLAEQRFEGFIQFEKEKPKRWGESKKAKKFYLRKLERNKS